jgi:hypothetical protein
VELVLIDTFVCLMPRPRPHCFLLDVWDVVVGCLGCFGLVEYLFLFLFLICGLGRYVEKN